MNRFKIEQTSYVAAHPKVRQASLTRLLLLTGLCLLLGAFNMRPALTSLATVLADVDQDLGAGRLWSGIITTAPVLCFGIFGPIAPWLAGRLGLERTIALLLLLLFTGLALRSQASAGGLIVSTLIAGAAIGMAGVLLPVVIRRDFPDRAGIATGLYTMAMSIGGASAAGFTPTLERMTGSWTSALAIWSLPALATALAWGGLTLVSHRAARMARLPHFSTLLRDRMAWNVTAFMGLQAGLAFIVLGWLPTLLRARGYGGTEAGVVTSISILAQTITALLVPAMAARRISSAPLVLLVLGATIAGFLGLLYAPVVGRIFWALVLGLGQGGLFGLALLFISLRSPSAEAAAMLSGMSQSIGYLGASLGPFAIGILRGLGEGSEGPITFFLAIAALCTMFGLRAAKPSFVLTRSADVRQRPRAVDAFR
ncbi:MFS transporter [Microvirga puerhi]|uniref:MFS transporter n=1 Tax=Microvirga puerhi TaxID=2876078 RepID=A0ABS7VH90_9HYPH|nr:MFS transporter [Microvirga puerhi]MBZ6074867.1 MFS transporter [Microvirga puerhi]